MNEVVLFVGFVLLAVGAILGAGIWRLVLTIRIRRDQRELLWQVDKIQRDLSRLRAASSPSGPSPPNAPSSETASVPQPEPPPLPPPETPEPVAPAGPVPPPIPVFPSPVVDDAVPYPVAAEATTSITAKEATTEKESTPEKPENSALRVLRKAWNWFIVNEEFRPTGVSTEYAVATTWLVRCGILIVLLGIVFTLTYSINHGWLGPGGRVALSLFAGVVMIAGGTRLLANKYRPLGQGFIGGGLATLYFACFAASQMYGLIPDLAAFGLMVVVTVSAAVLADRADSKLIAVLGLIGGYATPFLLKASGLGFSPLFVYLLLLGIGVFGLAHRRQWILLNYLGFLFTWAHVANMSQQISLKDHWGHFLPFLVAFFVLYSAVVCVYNLANRRPVTLLELFGLVANAAVFFLFAFHTVESVHGREWGGLVPLGLAVFYTALVYVFLRQGLRDRPLMLMLLALAGFFAAITLPCVLSRSWLTAGWALQALLLLWLARKLDSRFLRYISFLLYAITILRLATFDLRRQFVPLYRAHGPVFSAYLAQLVGRFFAIGIPIACFAGAWRLGGASVTKAELQVSEENDVGTWVADRRVLPLFLWCALGGSFVYAYLELDRMFAVLFDPLRAPVLTGLWVLLGVCALLFLRQTAGRLLRWLLGGVAVILVLKFLFLDLNGWQFNIEVCRYGRGWDPITGLMRFLDFGLVIGFFAWGAFAASTRSQRRTAVDFAILAGVFLFVYLTIEVNTFFWVYVKGLRAGAVSILWSILALSCLILGIRNDVRPLRFCGLGLFLVVVGKVLFSDLAYLGAGWRILAFIVLGCIVLLGALVYLKNQQHFVSQVNDTEDEA